MQNWNCDENVDPLPDSTIDDTLAPGNEEEQDINVPELAAYRELFSKSPIYQWFLARLRREILLAPMELNSVGKIRETTISSLPYSPTLSRYNSSQAFKMVFEMVWDPIAFVKQQEYLQKPSEAIEFAIILTESTIDAQATTCGHYVRQTWPMTGEHTLEMIRNAIRR
jgi:hypothetical protein